MMGTKITDKVLGLIGMGRIAQAVAHKSHFGFNMRIVYYDPYFKNYEIAEKFNATKMNSVLMILEGFRFCIFALPFNKRNKGFNQSRENFKNETISYLINTARGDIVVEDDLVTALEKKLINGAGLDVYERARSSSMN